MNPKQYYMLRNTFDDFDDLSATVRDWDMDLRQIEKGPFQGSITQIIGETIQLGRGQFGRDLEQTGSPPPGLRTFVIPAGPSVSFHWRGIDVVGDQVLVFPAGGELYAVSKAGFDVFTISLSEESLADIGEHQGLPAILDLINGREVFACDPTAMERARGICRYLDGLPEKNLSGRVSSTIYRNLEFKLPAALIWSLGSSHPLQEKSRPRLRDSALKRVLSFIKEMEEDYPTVKDLINVSGVSRRTLEYAFMERFGMSPDRYLKTIRLNGVHKELKKADTSEVIISDVANEWGFWHMGQFAADYRRLFGELPSETLSTN